MLRAGWLLVAALALAACDEGDDPTGYERGPMIVGSAQGSSITRPVGSVFTDGIQVLTLGGDEPGKLTKVEVVGDGGVELVGAKVLPPPRELAAVQFLEGWPPQGTGDVDLGAAVPAIGAEVGTAAENPQGWELLLGLRVVEEGRWTRRAIRVTYTVGDKTYRVDLPTELVVCTSEKYEVEGRCPAG